MKKSARDIIRLDLTRYNNEYGFLKPDFLKWQIVYRKASAYSKRSVPGLFYRIRLRRLSQKTGIQIPTKAKIGAGLRLAHNGSIIVNPDAVIGRNVNLAPGVVIGKTNRGDRAGVPRIADRVWIGANAVIVGDIRIGEDVLIAPGAYVNIDVPPHSIVVGNPAVIHHRDNATAGYINDMM